MIKTMSILSIGLFFLISLAEVGSFIVAVIGAIAGGYSLMKQAKIKAEMTLEDARIEALEKAQEVNNKLIESLRARVLELETDNSKLGQRIDELEKENSGLREKVKTYEDAEQAK